MVLKKSHIKTLGILCLALFHSPITQASTDKIETLGLSDLLKVAIDNSKSVQSAQLKLESISEATKRSQLHWTPQLYIDGRSYTTNDPGMSLFSKLSEKTITQLDFQPSQLVNPVTQTHYRLTAGAELPIYEGGGKSATAQAYEYIEKGQKEETDSIQNQERARLYHSYSEIIRLNNKIAALEKVKTAALDFSKNYKLSNSNNPVGRSGALGIKNFLNRINTEITLAEAEKDSIQLTLSKIWMTPQKWNPKNKSVTELESEVRSSLIYSAESAQSYKVIQNQLAAQQELVSAKKSIYKPRLGLFAESYTYANQNNSSNSTNSYMAGAYVHWNRWSSEHYGVGKESELNVGSLQSQSSLMLQNADATLSTNKNMTPLLVKQIQSMDESIEIMQEQTQISKGLFQSGSINVLQLIEVYNRLADIIGKKSELEHELGKTISSTISFTGVDSNVTK